MSGAAGRIVLLVALGGALAGCGKKGPPEPPVRILPATPGVIAARQVGGDILLSATLRPTRTDGTALAAGAEVRVMRMPSAPGFRPGVVSERYLVQQFLQEAAIIASLDPRTPQGGAAGRLAYHDRGVVPAGEGAAVTDAPGAPTTSGAPTTPAAPAAPAVPAGFLYGLRVVEPGGKSSLMRVPVLVEVAPPPSPPGSLEGEVVEGEVRLKWQPAPGGGAYNVYRRESPGGPEPEAPINPTPLTVTEFVDRTFHYDTDYQYFVRTAIAGRATPCESPAGPEFAVRPHDQFAPVAPTGIAVAVEGQQIRVYWFPNAEQDLAGYRIYRRAEDETEFRLVGEVGPAESSWADPGAAPAVRYHYAVSAIDGATPINEGPRSEERSERLPPAGTPAAEETPPGAGRARR